MKKQKLNLSVDPLRDKNGNYSQTTHYVLVLTGLGRSQSHVIAGIGQIDVVQLDRGIGIEVRVQCLSCGARGQVDGMLLCRGPSHVNRTLQFLDFHRATGRTLAWKRELDELGGTSGHFWFLSPIGDIRYFFNMELPQMVMLLVSPCTVTLNYARMTSIAVKITCKLSPDAEPKTLSHTSPTYLHDFYRSTMDSNSLILTVYRILITN